MNFSRIGRQLDEGFSSGPAGEATRAANEKAVQSKQKSVQTTERSRQSQKAHMSQEKQAPEKSGVSYTSEESNQLRKMREINKMRSNEMTDWRQEMMEAAKPDAEGNHPFIDVMPFADHKLRNAKKQMKDAVKSGKNQAAQGGESPVAEETRELCAILQEKYGMSDDEFFEYAKKKGFKVPPKKKAVKEARNPDTDGSREADIKKIDSMPKPHTERGKEKKVNYGKASTKEIAKDYDDHLKRRMTYDQRPVSRRREALRKGMNG